jgi:hypothetical protein
MQMNDVKKLKNALLLLAGNKKVSVDYLLQEEINSLEAY